jgi:hypothetical protein
MNLVELARCGWAFPIHQVTFDLIFDKNKLYQKLFDAVASCNVSNGVSFCVRLSFHIPNVKIVRFQVCNTLLMNLITDYF